MQLYNNGNHSFLYEPLNETVYKSNPLVDGNHIIQLYRLFLMNSQYIYDFVDGFLLVPIPEIIIACTIFLFTVLIMIKFLQETIRIYY